MARQLLIMPCSATKSPAECAIKAAERYTGSLWQTLNTTLGHEDAVKSLNNIGVDLYVLSAKHGLISADELIEDYDQRMTKDRQLEILGDEKLSTNIRNVLKNYPEEAVYLGGLGKDYKKLIENVMGKEYPQDKNSRLPRGIGDKRKALKEWLQAYMASKAIETILPAESTPDMMNIPDWLRKGMATLRKGAPIVSFLEAVVHDYKDLPEDKKKEIEGVVEDILDPVKRGLGSFTTLFQQEESPPPGPETNVQDIFPGAQQQWWAKKTGMEETEPLNTSNFRVAYLPVNQAYVALFGKDPETASIVPLALDPPPPKTPTAVTQMDEFLTNKLFPNRFKEQRFFSSLEEIDSVLKTRGLQRDPETNQIRSVGENPAESKREPVDDLNVIPAEFPSKTEDPDKKFSQGGFVDKPLYDRDRSYYG
tara:strand:+ start:96 stop:1361 length:1266 start_codon:yes stop_codon:yes gene_type:complete